VLRTPTIGRGNGGEVATFNAAESRCHPSFFLYQFIAVMESCSTVAIETHTK
jgi:hypothetical protein